MADNRIAYGLAKKYGIDTTGMSPKEVWEALRKKGVTEKNIADGAYNSQEGRATVLARQLREKKGYTKILDSAVMNKYSSVRKIVDKKGYSTITVSDGEYQYWVKIKKSDSDFEYEILRRKKI